MHSHLRRLEWIRRGTPLFFLTTNTKHRQAILTRREIASILIEEWKTAFDRHGWKVGRYVVMPDHVQFLCWPSMGEAQTLSRFLQAWKQWTCKRIVRECDLEGPIWQAEFFDHLVRSTKSAMQKYEYML
jgi:putative transposase